jgi:hypothetical protein
LQYFRILALFHGLQSSYPCHNQHCLGQSNKGIHNQHREQPPTDGNTGTSSPSVACRRACDSIVSSKNDVTNLDLWFVGGWVRDRLLDRQSSDIDVALSSMTGIQFGHALENYLQREKHKYRGGKAPQSSHRNLKAARDQKELEEIQTSRDSKFP